MRVAGWLNSAAAWLNKKPEEEGGGTRYVDLAPTDQADPVGAYSAALTQATNSSNVMNIALTGPYGSGKSSIIKSFLKGYNRSVLQISLAAFLPEAGSTIGTVSRQEIERSILQQMLYGADSKQLPLSRFKRIQSPGRWSTLASLFMTIGVIACWHLLQERNAIITGDYFLPFDLTNWFNLLNLVIGGGFIWGVIHHLYIASFGISLKSISLKDIEIAPQAASAESILNRYLDEIIYFFQSTKYDLVVIEDLDRFNSAEIFVTLREINSLVNANLFGKRHIRFLYALRDDVFVNTDRTKFFEFIIPVIPIINSSNSIDKVLEQGKRLSLDDRLDHQFLREVSRYLNDLRLIQNIFNEYAIYVANLETESESNLDVNRLLAVLIYKNVFPRDFENLHRGKGNLAEVLRSHDRYISLSESRYLSEISRLQELIDLGESQLPNDVNELRRIYAMAVVEVIPEGYSHVGVNSSNMHSINSLASGEILESILGSRQIAIRNNYGNAQNFKMPEVEAKIDPHRNFRQRLENTEKKSATFKTATLKKIQEMRQKMGTLRLTKFNEVLRDNADQIDGLFAAFGDGADLARFLVLEGYLDDTYYQYTSLFHSGRLSPSDNKFLIHIRSFRNPDPDFQIDNPKEVISAMRSEDFGRGYVLNVTIVDCLLSDSTLYETQTKRMLEFMASNFGNCEQFLSSYYARGSAVSALLSGLLRVWPGFVASVLISPANLVHVARIFSHLSSESLKLLTDRHQSFAEFVSERLTAILDQGVEFPAEQLESLNIEVTDLAAVEAHPRVMRVLFDAGLYELSIDNLHFLFRAILGVGNSERIEEQNYTLALETESAPLLAKIDSNFSEYLQNVLLRLPNNCRETIPTMRRVIDRGDVEFKSIVDFLEKQSTPFPSLDQIPDKFHATLFEIGKIEATWDNCLTFLISKNYNAETLTLFLNSSARLSALAAQQVPDGDLAAPLRNFIISNNELSEEAYAAYVTSLPRRFRDFPTEISAEKTKILVDLNKVIFSAGNLSYLRSHSSLGVAFVVRNISDFFEVEGECAIDDDFRQKLLEGEITDEDRLKIIRKLDLSLLADMPSRAAIIGRTLARTGGKIDNLSVEGARAVIVSSRPLAVQISLFNKLHKLFDDPQVREILNSLPDPLPDIRPGFATPKIEGNDVNLEFVTWLQDRRFISSWRRSAFDDDIRISMFRK